MILDAKKDNAVNDRVKTNHRMMHSPDKLCITQTSLYPIYAMHCKTNKYIPYSENVENDYIIYIYYATVYNLYLYYTLAILYTGKSLVKKMQGTRERVQRHA